MAGLFRKFLEGDGKSEVVTCNNTIVFLTTVVQKVPPLKAPMGTLLEPLIFIVKERTGQPRKSAAILLANLCQEKDNLEEARRLHGTEVLMNLSKLLLESK